MTRSPVPLAPDDPKFVETYTAMIESARDEALIELEALTAAHPTSVAAWAMLSQLHQRRLDLVASGEASRRLLELDPKHPDGLHRRAYSLMQTGDWEAALDAYRQTYAITRSSYSGHLIALLLHRLGRFEESAKAYDTLMAVTAPGTYDSVPILRDCMSLLRDWGRPIVADRYAHMLTYAYRISPAKVGSILVDRDQSTTYREWLGLTDKSQLAALLRRTLAAEPGAWAPETFVLPADRAMLMAYAASAPEDALYIVKPARGSGGQGIAVVNDLAAVIDRTNVVVQRYVADPYLANGRKGHLRIYALITSPAPLRAYIYTEGIVRFAPELYDPSPERLNDLAMHVTNTALHVSHPNLKIDQDPRREDQGAIWSLSALLKHMGAHGLDGAQVFDKISDLVAWFLRGLSRDGFFARQAAAGPPRAFGPKLLGFDVLVDRKGYPSLIEIQSSPAANGAPLTDRINGELFANILRMNVGVLTSDSLSADALQTLRTDPAAIARAELAIEQRQMGRFRLLSV